MKDLLALPLFLAIFVSMVFTALPWLSAAAVGGCVWAAARSARRGVRVASGVALPYFLCAAVCGFAHARWTAWHYGGNGLTAGMTVDEVERTLKARSPRLEKVRFDATKTDAYEVYPAGLAGVAEGIRVPLPELYYVNVEFGKDGRLVRADSWSD